MEFQLDEKTLLCPKCGKGHMLPMQDAFSTSQSYIKGWVCSNVECDNNFFYSKGSLIKLHMIIEKIEPR